MLRKVLLTLTLLSALTAVGTFAAAGSAQAAPIANAITSVTLTSTSTVGQYDYLDFQCQWAVPDGSAPGDTFTMQLPAQLQWAGSSDFNLTDTAGNVVATAHADNSGLVTFTLSSFVATHPVGVHGSCDFATQFIQAQTQAGPTTLDFTVGSTVLRVPVTEYGPCTQNCTVAPPTTAYKSMWWQDPHETALYSIIQAPATTSDLNSVTILDKPAPGTTIDCTQIRTQIGGWDGVAGSVVDPDQSATYPAAVACSPTLVTATWSAIPAGLFTRLSISTPVSTASQSQYVNTGTVTMNGQAAPVTATVEKTTEGGTGTGSTPTPSPTPTPTPTPVAATTPAPTQSVPPTAVAPLPATGAVPPANQQPVSGPSEALASTGSDVSALTPYVATGLALLGTLLLTITSLRRSRSVPKERA